MVNVISVASELGYLNIPENTLIDIDQVKNYPDEKVVLITTGSQGESMAASVPNGGKYHKRLQLNRTIPLFSVPTRFREMRKQFPRLSMSCP